MVAANAWMNAPSGFTLDSAGEIVEVDPWSVIFNDAMPLMAAHMIVAAYVVGGFLIASVYAVGMLRGRRDRYHRLGFLIPFTVAAIAIPIQMGVGDSLARWVYNNQPVKFAAIELVPETSERRARDAVRPPQRRRHRSAAASRSPAWRRGCPIRPTARTPSSRASTPCPPTSGRPIRQVNSSTSPGTSWSASARCCSCSRSGTARTWMFRRDMPKSKLFLRIASVAGRRWR